jgi:hypothetical protein
LRTWSMGFVANAKCRLPGESLIGVHADHVGIRDWCTSWSVDRCHTCKRLLPLVIPERYCLPGELAGW